MHTVPTLCDSCGNKALSLSLRGNMWICRDCKPERIEAKARRKSAQAVIRSAHARMEQAKIDGKGVRLTAEETHYIERVLVWEIDQWGEEEPSVSEAAMSKHSSVSDGGENDGL